MQRRIIKFTVLITTILMSGGIFAKNTDMVKPITPDKFTPTTLKAPNNLKSGTGKDIIIAPQGKTTDSNVVNSFDFNNVDVLSLVKQISKLTGKRFMINESIASKKGITIIAPTAISVQEAYDVFLSVLDANDLAISKAGKFLRIGPKKEITSGVTIYKGDYFPRNDEYITRLIKLKNVNAGDLATDLTDRRGGGFVPLNVKIKALEDTNTILVTGTGSQLADLEEIIRLLDISGDNSKLEVIHIKNADASKIKEIIDNIIFQPGGAGKTMNVMAKKDISRGAERYSKIFTDERTNSIIVLANNAGIRKIKELVAKLDFEVQGDKDSDIHIYPLKNARAEDINTTLGSIIGAKSGTTKDSTFDAVKITADKWTNSIVVNAKPRQYDAIKAVIEGLDRRKGQVLFETITMEISLSDDSSFGVSSNYALSSEVPRAIGFDAGVSSTNNIMNFLTNPSALSGMILGFGSSKTVSVTLNGSTIKIPSLAAFITAIEKNSEANVLQRPSIITSDNEQAEIKVMDKIPVVSSTVVQQGLSQQNITNVDVGLSLKITPRINLTSDFIKLDIEQETSNLTDKAPKDLANTTVSTNSRNIKTSVVVRDRDTVVLGGLCSDNVNVTYNKVPVLGDIPILGWLFKGKTTSSMKTNLLVFITPNIVRDYETHSALTKSAIKNREGFMKEQMGGVDRFGKFTNAIKNKVDLQTKEEDVAKNYDMPEGGVKPLKL
ncbi:MAG: type II secretion system secretin GspD [Proteobacteria bacterium]|nr:type II secretion system secretin GspD [Pseudomonadota bacterium]